MARLYICYVPGGNLALLPPDQAETIEAKQALLDLPDSLESVDIYEQAKKLAELLLENLG